MTIDPESPRALRSPEERARRRSLLTLPHIAPLSDYVGRLRAQCRGSVPDFDPLDGGIGARALFLMEKPGPMTDAEAPPGARTGSGFVSRDNDDPTAEATFRFMREAGLPRAAVVLWNLIPWWNGTRRISAQEQRDGALETAELIRLLPDLRVIVLVGARARRQEARLRDLGLPVLTSAHPSPIVRASRPAAWRAIPEAWKQALPLIHPDS